MSRITPQAHINIGYKTKYEFFKTYQELKKQIPNLFVKYGVKSILVLRSRRGEWGEWFERWEMDYRAKPTIIKSGWS